MVGSSRPANLIIDVAQTLDRVVAVGRPAGVERIERYPGLLVEVVAYHERRNDTLTSGVGELLHGVNGKRTCNEGNEEIE